MGEEDKRNLSHSWANVHRLLGIVGTYEVHAPGFRLSIACFVPMTIALIRDVVKPPENKQFGGSTFLGEGTPN